MSQVLSIIERFSRGSCVHVYDFILNRQDEHYLGRNEEREAQEGRKYVDAF